MVMLLLKPKSEPFPSVKIAFKSAGALTMTFKILRHPGVPATAVDGAGIVIKFLGLHLGARGAGLDGLTGIFSAEAGGFVAPDAVGVNKLDEPERRSLFFIDQGH